MKTEAKNRALWGLRAALALWIAFFLSRFTFFSLHYMSQWPFALFVFGLIVIFTSAILDGRKVMIATPTGYTVGFALGMLFNIDSLDAGSGALNNAWKIWIGTYLAFIVLGIIWEIVTRLIKKCKTNNNLRRSIRKDTFILALTLVVLFTFTACGSNSNTEAPAEEQGNNDISSDIEIIINSSWQEAYTEILRLYATGQHLNEWETGWEFTLHDINQDGIPELFLGARQISGHIDYRYVYTFLGGEEISGGAVRLDFQGFLTDGAIFSPIDNSPWVVVFLAVGSGGRYIKLEMIDLGLVPTVEGTAFMSDEGHEMMLTQDDFDWQNYEWYNLTINDVEVTAEEFENIFGAREDRAWLNFNEVKSFTNPYTEAISKYLSYGIDTSDPHMVIAVRPRVFLADITGRGDYGVIAVRHMPKYIEGIRQPADVITQARIFWCTGQELIYKDIREAIVGISSLGRVAILTQWGAEGRGFTLLDIKADLHTKTDVIFSSFTIATEWEVDDFAFFSFPGGFEQEGVYAFERNILSEEDFEEIMAKYGLADWRAWGHFRDEFDAILAMTFQ